MAALLGLLTKSRVSFFLIFSLYVINFGVLIKWNLLSYPKPDKYHEINVRDTKSIQNAYDLYDFNLSRLNTGFNCNVDPEWDDKWGIGIIHININKEMKSNDDIDNNHFIFDMFNNKSLQYNRYSIYNCDDIQNDKINKSLNVSFTADPFLYIMGNKWYLFYEIKLIKNVSHGSNKGEIAASLSMDNGNSWQYLGVVLSEDFHLSFPNIINNYLSYSDENNDDKYIYMIPETNKDHSIRIYKTSKDSFPYHWSLHRKKLFNLTKQWADTNIIYYNNRYFIFTHDCTPNKSALFIYYTNENSDLFDSEWYSHSNNPFYLNNNKYSRPAGNPYFDTISDRIYRFTQDGSNYYGERIHIFMITKLDIFEFEELLIDTIEPSVFKGNNVVNIHHINIYSDVIFFDFVDDIPRTKVEANDNYSKRNKYDLQKLNIDSDDLDYIHLLPKLIHIVWITDDINDDNEVDKQHRENIDTFYKIYADDDWKIIVWTNNNIRNVFCSLDKNAEYEKECKLFTNKTFSIEYNVTLSIKSDVLRFMILYKFGGMYFDADFIAVKSMKYIIGENIDNYGLIICHEDSFPSRSISGGFFASYPQNKYVGFATNNIMSRIQLKNLDSDSRTGPCFWKRAIISKYYNNASLLDLQNENITNLLISFNISDMATQLPSEYLYKFGFDDRIDIDRKNELFHSKDPNMYAMHLWDASWVDFQKLNDEEAKTEYNVYVNRKRKILYCAIENNYDLMFKNLFIAIDNDDTKTHYNDDTDKIHELFTNITENKSGTKWYEYLEILNDKSWKKLMILRDPLERLLSGYLDSFGDDDDNKKKKKKTKKKTNKKFKLIVEKMMMQNDSEDIEEYGFYIYPQSGFCDIDRYLKKYNNVIISDSNSVGKKTFNFLKRNKLSKYYKHWKLYQDEIIDKNKKIYKQYYDKDLAKKAINFYKNDYENLNLSYPDWIKSL